VLERVSIKLLLSFDGLTYDRQIMIRIAHSFLAKPTLFVLAGIAITLATTAVTAVSLYQMRLDAMSQASNAAQNLVNTLKDETERHLDIYQLAMGDVATSVQTPDIFHLAPDVRQHVAFSIAGNTTDLGSVFATDAEGNFILDSNAVPPRNINVSDRDYFQIQQRTRDAGLYLSEPFRSRGFHLNEPLIALSSRLEDRHGQFIGIAAATLRLSYFHQMFEDSILGPHGTITLVRTDGVILMRQPYRASDIGRTLAGGHSFPPMVASDQGTYVDIAVLDHIERLYSFKRIGKYPLVVSVGFATEDIYAGWRKRAIAIGIVTFVLDVLFITLSLMFSGQLRMRLAMERQLQQLAWFDALTGLPNRVQLHREASRVLEQADQQGSGFATLFIDLDRFKRVNDTQGHLCGDEVLSQIAKRLRDHVRGEDLVGRLGGDEFLAILPHCDVLKATHIAGRILHAVSEPIVINSKQGTRITISASIGIAMYPHDGQESDTLLRNADMAMYQAKSAGRNQVHFYAPEYERQAKEHLELEIALQRALQSNGLSVVYQPKIDAAGTLRGAEALARWHNEKQGHIRPDRFIAIAEESGLIADLDAWILDEACRQLAEWRSRGIDVPNIAVNVCAADFKRPAYPEFVAQTLRDHGLAPTDLTLEMTERVMFDESTDDIRSVLDAIHALGIALSIDDFGTGYSSLSYLHRFPVTELKIDKSFVHGIGGDTMAESLAQTVINIGNVLKLTVTAEGVETQTQRDFLSAHGCHLYQGFLFSVPLPPEAFAQWVLAHR